MKPRRPRWRGRSTLLLYRRTRCGACEQAIGGGKRHDGGDQQSCCRCVRAPLTARVAATTNHRRLPCGGWHRSWSTSSRSTTAPEVTLSTPHEFRRAVPRYAAANLCLGSVRRRRRKRFVWVRAFRCELITALACCCAGRDSPPSSDERADRAAPSPLGLCRGTRVLISPRPLAATVPIQQGKG